MGDEGGEEGREGKGARNWRGIFGENGKQPLGHTRMVIGTAGPRSSTGAGVLRRRDYERGIRGAEGKGGAMGAKEGRNALRAQVEPMPASTRKMSL